MSSPEVQPLEVLLDSAYRYALSLAQHQQQAEDVLQDAWLAVLKAGGPQTRPYLFAAVRSRFLNAHKREQLVPFVSIDQASDFELAGTGEDLDDYCDHVLLNEALAELRAVEREALFLMVVEGYTAEEVALFTDQPRGTVLSLVHRAKSKLKVLLTEPKGEQRHE